MWPKLISSILRSSNLVIRERMVSNDLRVDVNCIYKTNITPILMGMHFSKCMPLDIYSAYSCLAMKIFLMIILGIYTLGI